jgi:predicted nuclease with TOPRIM domain
MALDERLRSLKVKETRLKNTFDEAQKKFVEWKKKHASELPNPETDSMIKTWREEMKKMLPALPGLAFYTAPVSS